MQRFPVNFERAFPEADEDDLFRRAVPFEKCFDLSDGNSRRAVHGKTVCAGADRGKANRPRSSEPGSGAARRLPIIFLHRQILGWSGLRRRDVGCPGQARIRLVIALLHNRWRGRDDDEMVAAGALDLSAAKLAVALDVLVTVRAGELEFAHKARWTGKSFGTLILQHGPASNPKKLPTDAATGWIQKTRNCSSRRKEAHFEENQWNRASLRRLLRILESALT